MELFSAAFFLPLLQKEQRSSSPVSHVVPELTCELKIMKAAGFIEGGLLLCAFDAACHASLSFFLFFFCFVFCSDLQVTLIPPDSRLWHSLKPEQLDSYQPTHWKLGACLTSLLAVIWQCTVGALLSCFRA